MLDKVKIIKIVKGFIRNKFKPGKAGPHSSKKGNKGYNRKIKHKEKIHE